MFIKTTDTNAGELCITCWAFGCEWEPEALRSAYEAMVQTWTGAGLPPNRLGSGGRWGSFRHKRPHLERSGFAAGEGLSLAHQVEGAEYSEDALVHASIFPPWTSVSICWLPSLIGAEADASLRGLWKELMECGSADYGYLTNSRLSRSRRGIPDSDPLSPDEEYSRSASYWAPYGSEQAGSLLLRGVYPTNYLREAFLNAPVGMTGASLREWIAADPMRRGSVVPLTASLSDWSLPAANIPQVREELFRAGRVYFDRFFRELDYQRVVLPSGIVPRETIWRENIRLDGPMVFPPERFYRPEIHEPWESPEPIPEMFTAEYYAKMCPEEIN